MRIMVSSPRQSINAISGVMLFPTDKLQVTSVSKIGSVLSLWVQEPSFSNSQGQVVFEGVVPNPGFSESNGRVLAVNFKVVGTGEALIRLASGSLLANDGYGTNILKTLGTASYMLEQRQELPLTPPAVIENGSSDATGFIELPQKPQQEKSPGITFGFSLSSIDSILSWLLKFFSVVIPLVALIFLLLHTTKKGINSVQKLRSVVRKDLHDIDRLIEKSFELLKEDVSDSIHILEQARSRRKLTEEEEAIIQRFKQNLVDAEKVIHREVLHAEKDIGG